MSKVSVIIPTYNRVKYICEAIDSALAQTYKDFEIIIVDDGSTDNTKEVLKIYGEKIIYIYQENKGVSAARNRGVREASGKFVAFLDADDIWLPNKLSEQVHILNNNYRIGLVGSLMEMVNEKGISLNQIKPKVFPGKTFESALRNGSPPLCTFMLRKECFDKIGLFDEKLKIFEDLDLYLRISFKYDIEIIDKVLGKCRMHPENITKNERLVYAHQIILAKKWLPVCSSRYSKNVLMEKINKYSLLLLKKSIKNFNVLDIFRYFFYYNYSSLWLSLNQRDNKINLKVLFIESGSGFGGSAKCLFLLLKHFDKNKFHPKVIYYNCGPSIEVIIKDGISATKYNFFNLLTNIIKSDIVYINNDIYSHFLSILLSKVFFKKCICHMRGIRKLTRGEKAVSALIDRFIAVSHICSRNLIEQGINKERIAVIYDGIEIKKDVAPKDLTNGFAVGVVSRIIPKKGHFVFLEAARIIIRKGIKAKFIIFGDDTDKEKSTKKMLEEKVKQEHLGEYVSFLGWETDLDKIYSMIDIAVCPSELNESFGMNVAEAMGYGKPIVASSTGAYVELIQDGVNGLLFKPGVSSNLADKLEIVVNDGSLRKKLSDEAYKIACEKFSIEANIIKIEKLLYEETVNKR